MQEHRAQLSVCVCVCVWPAEDRVVMPADAAISTRLFIHLLVRIHTLLVDICAAAVSFFFIFFFFWTRFGFKHAVFAQHMWI